MRSSLTKLSALLLLWGLCGCQTSPPRTAPPTPEGPTTSEKKTFDPVVRDNALALLDDLLNDEKNLSKILIIKHNSDELGRLVANISKTAGTGAKLLESLAKQDPTINLKETALPPGEAATRKAISKTKEHLLLHSKDEEFEFQLLLTQSEGLNYGAHLAMVVAENEPQAERVQELLNLAAQLRNLQSQVLLRLRAPKTNP